MSTWKVSENTGPGALDVGTWGPTIIGTFERWFVVTCSGYYISGPTIQVIVCVFLFDKSWVMWNLKKMLLFPHIWVEPSSGFNQKSKIRGPQHIRAPGHILSFQMLAKTQTISADQIAEGKVQKHLVQCQVWRFKNQTKQQTTTIPLWWCYQTQLSQRSVALQLWCANHFCYHLTVLEFTNTHYALAFLLRWIWSMALTMTWVRLESMYTELT